MKTFNIACALLCAATSAAQVSNPSGGRWKADWQMLRTHKAPAWILDAKFGIQYVGEPMDLSDSDAWHWGQAEYRYRELGQPPIDKHVEAHRNAFSIVGKFPYVWQLKPIRDYDAVLARYRDLGARYIVSMIQAAFPGTEGLRMDSREIRAARRAGLKVGVHFNLLGRELIPSIGDPGYVEWFHKRLRDAVEEADADFVFFDGSQATSSYFKTAEFVAWYYNWAERRNKEVWVNDDLGRNEMETGEYGDVVDLESMVTEGVSPRPWLDWDILRNDWTCWVNEFGIHKTNGSREKWRYKAPDALLRIFLDAVSKNGGWLVQIDNTGQSWTVVEEIANWLKINGEAVYSTRPYGIPNPRFVPAPKNVTRQVKGQSLWWPKYEATLRIAEQQPVYYTRKGPTVYAVHWGWPTGEFVLTGVHPQAGAKIRMLGAAGDLNWRMQGSELLVEKPAAKPAGKWAYTLVIDRAGE
jgi:alpha-L-fucosidase